MVCKLPGNKLEKIYSKYSLAIENTIKTAPAKKLTGQIDSQFSQLAKELKSEAPSEQLFKESFMEIQYRNSEKIRMLIKYMLAKINAYLENTDEHQIDFNRVNIEHLLPQNPSADWNLSKQEIKGYVHLLGNLTLISMKINSRLQNGPINQKLHELAKSELSITRDVVQLLTNLNGEWNEQTIRDRQEYLADIAYKLYFR